MQEHRESATSRQRTLAATTHTPYAVGQDLRAIQYSEQGEDPFYSCGTRTPTVFLLCRYFDTYEYLCVNRAANTAVQWYLFFHPANLQLHHLVVELWGHGRAGELRLARLSAFLALPHGGAPYLVGGQPREPVFEGGGGRAEHGELELLDSSAGQVHFRSLGRAREQRHRLHNVHHETAR